MLGIPFPIPKLGNEPIWNHKLRYRGTGIDRWNNQTAVTATGDFNLTKIHEQGMKEGMETLMQDGLVKVLKGFTTLQQIKMVCMK